MDTLFKMEPPRPVDFVQSLEGNDAIEFINALQKVFPRTVGNAFNHRLLDDLRKQLTSGIRRTLSPKQSAAVAYIAIGINFEFRNHKNYFNRSDQPNSYGADRHEINRSS